MTVYLRSLETAVPPTVLIQTEARDVFAAQPGLTRLGTRLVSTCFDSAAIDTRYTAVEELTLDRRAQSIARAAGPFGRFSEAMRRKADQIVVVSRFKFTREAALETRLLER